MTSMLLASAAAQTVNTGTTVILAGVIAATVSLIVGFTAAYVTTMTEKSRQEAAIKLKKLELDAARIAAKYDLLRQTAAEFALTTIEFAECASAVHRGRSVETEQRLWAANGKLRMQLEALLLISESTAVQKDARLVVRAAKNERKWALGEPREYPRLLGRDVTVLKEMRAHLRPFLKDVRSELGIEAELAEDLEEL